MDTIIKHYADHGIKRFLLLTGYKHEQVVDAYSDWATFRQLNMLVVCALGGTISALQSVEHLLDNQFLLLNGDTFCPINPHDMQIPTWSSRVANIALSNKVDVGIRCMNKVIIKQMRRHTYKNIEEVLPYLDVAVQEFDLPWIDIGTPENYEKAKVIFR